MTMLKPTSRMVARNSNLSDFSFLAMPIMPSSTSSETFPGLELRSPRAVSSHQSASGRGTSFPGRGNLGPHQPLLHRDNRLMTAHHSQPFASALSPLPCDPRHLLLEARSPLRVVPKHVEAGASRR